MEGNRFNHFDEKLGGAPIEGFSLCPERRLYIENFEG
jgi:hypothetical protein